MISNSSKIADQKNTASVGKKSVCTSRIKDVEKHASTIRQHGLHFKKYLEKSKKLVSASRMMVRLWNLISSNFRNNFLEEIFSATLFLGGILTAKIPQISRELTFTDTDIGKKRKLKNIFLFKKFCWNCLVFKNKIISVIITNKINIKQSHALY